MSTSSGSDDDRERLLEALDPQFLVAETKKDEDKSNGKCTAASAALASSKSNGQQKIPSLRKTLNDEEDWNHLGTTSGFRSHVARHLSDILDRQIKEIDASERLAQHIKEENEGILLFASSTTPCVALDGTIKPQMQGNKKRKAPPESSSSSEDESKFKQVAVSGDWVLNKRGVYHENTRLPADIIISGDEHKRKSAK